MFLQSARLAILPLLSELNFTTSSFHTFVSSAVASIMSSNDESIILQDVGL